MSAVLRPVSLLSGVSESPQILKSVRSPRSSCCRSDEHDESAPAALAPLAPNALSARAHSVRTFPKMIFHLPIGRYYSYRPLYRADLLFSQTKYPD